MPTDDREALVRTWLTGDAAKMFDSIMAELAQVKRERDWLTRQCAIASTFADRPQYTRDESFWLDKAKEVCGEPEAR